MLLFILRFFGFTGVPLHLLLNRCLNAASSSLFLSQVAVRNEAQLADSLVRLAFAPATWRASRAHWRLWTDICDAAGVHPLRAEPRVVRLLVARLVSRRLAFGTVANCVSSVRRLLKAADVPDVTDHHSVRLVLKGAKRLLGARQTQKAPLLPEHLLQIRACLDFSRPLHVTFWAAALTGWWGLLRRSNLVGAHAVTRDSVQPLADGVRLTVRSSKTAQLGDRPRRLLLPRLRRPSRAVLLCPWTALVAHLRSGGRNWPGESRLFCYRSGCELRPLSEPMFSRLLGDSIRRAGITGDFASHSLRRGGATFASACGLPLDDIKTLGDWTSSVVCRYVGDHAAVVNERTAARLANSVSAHLAL
jgi:hypothetical protein